MLYSNGANNEIVRSARLWVRVADANARARFSVNQATAQLSTIAQCVGGCPAAVDRGGSLRSGYDACGCGVCGSQVADCTDTCNPAHPVAGTRCATAIPAPLDHESTPTFELALSVTDSGGLRATIALQVEIRDVNEAPALADVTFDVYEDAVGQVRHLQAFVCVWGF